MILNPQRRIYGLADSKVLTAEERERLAPIIRERALAWSVAWADRDEIDSLNILGATFLAMRRALLGLPVCPTHIQVDGNQLPRIDDLQSRLHGRGHHRGRCERAAISAASILAKTYRDAMMQQLDGCYPGFNWPPTRATHAGASGSAPPQGAFAAASKSFSPVKFAFETERG